MAWGINVFGVTNVSASNSGFMALAAGGNYSLGLIQPADCNANDILDECDIAGGLSTDKNSNGIPDDCEFPFGDIDQNGVVDQDDIVCILSSFAGDYACANGLSNADILPCGGDGQVTLDDLLAVLHAYLGEDLCP